MVPYHISYLFESAALCRSLIIIYIQPDAFCPKITLSSTLIAHFTARKTHNKYAINICAAECILIWFIYIYDMLAQCLPKGQQRLNSGNLTRGLWAGTITIIDVMPVDIYFIQFSPAYVERVSM